MTPDRPSVNTLFWENRTTAFWRRFRWWPGHPASIPRTISCPELYSAAWQGRSRSPSLLNRATAGRPGPDTAKKRRHREAPPSLGRKRPRKTASGAPHCCGAQISASGDIRKSNIWLTAMRSHHELQKAMRIPVGARQAPMPFRLARRHRPRGRQQPRTRFRAATGSFQTMLRIRGMRCMVSSR